MLAESLSVVADLALCGAMDLLAVAVSAMRDAVDLLILAVLVLSVAGEVALVDSSFLLVVVLAGGGAWVVRCGVRGSMRRAWMAQARV